MRKKPTKLKEMEKGRETKIYKFVSRNAQETVKERLTGDKWTTHTNGAVEHAARVDEQQHQGTHVR
jgi:hypothetical protein